MGWHKCEIISILRGKGRRVGVPEDQDARLHRSWHYASSCRKKHLEIGDNTYIYLKWILNVIYKRINEPLSIQRMVWSGKKNGEIIFCINCLYELNSNHNQWPNIIGRKSYKKKIKKIVKRCLSRRKCLSYLFSKKEIKKTAANRI